MISILFVLLVLITLPWWIEPLVVVLIIVASCLFFTAASLMYPITFVIRYVRHQVLIRRRRKR